MCYPSDQLRILVEGFFTLNQDIPAFKEHLRDFLVQIKVLLLSRRKTWGKCAYEWSFSLIISGIPRGGHLWSVFTGTRSWTEEGTGCKTTNSVDGTGYYKSPWHTGRNAGLVNILLSSPYVHVLSPSSILLLLIQLWDYVESTLRLEGEWMIVLFPALTEATRTMILSIVVPFENLDYICDFRITKYQVMDPHKYPFQ